MPGGGIVCASRRTALQARIGLREEGKQRSVYVAGRTYEAPIVESIKATGAGDRVAVDLRRQVSGIGLSGPAERIPDPTGFRLDSTQNDKPSLCGTRRYSQTPAFQGARHRIHMLFLQAIQQEVMTTGALRPSQRVMQKPGNNFVCTAEVDNHNLAEIDHGERGTRALINESLDRQANGSTRVPRYQVLLVETRDRHVRRQRHG